MKGKQVIENFEKTVKAVDPEAMNKIQVMAADAQMKMFDIHSRAIGCLCECLGMNAENAIASITDATPPYQDNHYHEVSQKWQLTNEKGEPLI